MESTVQLIKVNFAWPEATNPLFENLSVSFSCGWTALVLVTHDSRFFSAVCEEDERGRPYKIAGRKLILK